MLRLNQFRGGIHQIQVVINLGPHRGFRCWQCLSLFLVQLLIHLNPSESGLLVTHLLLLFVDRWEMKSVLRLEFRGVRADLLRIFLQLLHWKDCTFGNIIQFVILSFYKLIITWRLLMSNSRSARPPSNFIQLQENTPGIPKNQRLSVSCRFPS